MDHLEIEIKAYCDDVDAALAKVKAKHAVFIDDIDEDDIYYKHPSRDFGVTDEALRVRRANGSVLLTYKGPKLGTAAKSRIEEETGVSDFNTLKRILEHLGFSEYGRVSKKRRIYRLGNIDICLDEVKNLGSFIELEIKDQHREEAEKKLFDLAAELGITKFERKSYLELIYLK